MSTLQIDNNAHNTPEIPFSAKRSQLQARIVCGIFDYKNKKTRFNKGFVNSFPTNPDISQLHQGSVAAGSLGADEAPELNSQQQTPNEAGTYKIPSCTGPGGDGLRRAAFSRRRSYFSCPAAGRKADFTCSRGGGGGPACAPEAVSEGRGPHGSDGAAPRAEAVSHPRG